MLARRSSMYAGAFLLLALAGCGGAGSAGGEGGREAAVQFLDDLRAGRVEPAWQATSTEFKSLMGHESLRDYVKAHPALKGPAEYAESRPIEGALTECRFRATTKTKGKSVPATIKVLVGPTGEGWRVEKLSVE
jgi:hypothetical protein